MIEYAEDFTNSPTLDAIKSQCAKYSMYAIGTIPRKAENKYFNTAFVIGPKGQELTRMDKIHLFDIDIPGMTFVIAQGKSPTRKAKPLLLENKYACLILSIVSLA